MIKQAGSVLVLFVLAACSSTRPAEPLASVPVPVPNSASILAAADVSREEGRYGEALQIYQEILVREPKQMAARYGLAECLLGVGKPADAKAAYEELLQEPQYHALSLQGKGLALLVLNQREQAAKSLREATEADAALWRSWNGLGMLADLKRDWHQAEIAYAQALAINPDSAALHNNLGYSRLLAGKPGAAASEFRKAIGLEPDSETIQNNIRLSLAANGNYREAIRGVPKADEPMVLNNIGYVAMQRGDLAAAEGYLARAMESSSSYHTVASRNIEVLKALKTGN